MTERSTSAFEKTASHHKKTLTPECVTSALLLQLGQLGRCAGNNTLDLGRDLSCLKTTSVEGDLRNGAGLKEKSRLMITQDPPEHEGAVLRVGQEEHAIIDAKYSPEGGIAVNLATSIGANGAMHNVTALTFSQDQHAKDVANTILSHIAGNDTGAFCKTISDLCKTVTAPTSSPTTPSMGHPSR